MSFIRNPYSVKTSKKMQEREQLAKENHDFKEAISIARDYANLARQWPPFWHVEDKAIGWLYEAISFKPKNIKIEDVINLNDFFNSFTRLHCSYLFHDDALPLLNALKRNTTITELNLSYLPADDFSDSFNYANGNLASLLAETRSLKKLNISVYQNSFILKTTDMIQIANGLKSNISIEELNIQKQNIGDAGLRILLNELSNNPRTKLKKLNLLQTGITNEGAQLLINYLTSNITLTSVKLKLDITQENENNISTDNIKTLIKLNKSAHRAYSQGAMFGLFMQLHLPTELGLKTSNYLNRQDGRSVALTSKTPATFAKDEEGKVKLMKL